MLPISVNLVLFYCRSCFFSFKLLTSHVYKGHLFHRTISSFNTGLRKTVYQELGITNQNDVTFALRRCGRLKWPKIIYKFFHSHRGGLFPNLWNLEQPCDLLQPTEGNKGDGVLSLGIGTFSSILILLESKTAMGIRRQLPFRDMWSRPQPALAASNISEAILFIKAYSSC